MTISRYPLFFIFILTSISDCFPQSDFRKGYIIFNSGDTTFGYIEYRGNKSNAKKCMFTSDPSRTGKRIEYTPQELKGYRFTDSKYYISRDVGPKGNQERLFLEYLINGKVDIFYYRDDADEHYFADKGDNKLIPLTNEEKEVYIDYVRYQKESKQYIGVLKYIFQDSPEVAKETEKTSLNHKSLIDITRDYHYAVCKDEDCIVYEKKAPKVFLFIGPLVGANYTFITRISNEFKPEYYYFKYSKWVPSIYPAAGAFLSFSLPNLNERMFLQYNATLSYSKTSTSTVYYDEGASVVNHNEIFYSTYSVFNSLFFKYEALPGKFRPTLLIGGFLGINFHSDYMRQLNIELPYQSILYMEFPENEFKSIIYGITLGAGCIFKIHKDQAMFLDLQYYSGLGLFPAMNTNIISLNVGFPFKL